LATKIKADLEFATRNIDKRRNYRKGISLLGALMLCFGILSLLRIYHHQKDCPIDKCTAQLYLMRYNDVNALTGKDLFNDRMLSLFKYEDSLMTGTDVAVFPISNTDTLVTSTPPYFRVKLHNKDRNTIVFVEAQLEIDNYIVDTIQRESYSNPIEYSSDVDMIKINDNNKYLLKSFRQNVAYGETDDRYFFCISSDNDCSFRMRIRAKSQLGDYLYSNYIYVKYMR
jgi:hypothetical protein